MGTDRLELIYRQRTHTGSIVFYPQISNDLLEWRAIDAKDPNVVTTVVDPDVDGDGTAELVQVEFANADALFLKLFSEVR